MSSHVYKNAVWIADEETTMKTTVETRHNVIRINIQLIVYYTDNIVWTYIVFFGKKIGYLEFLFFGRLHRKKTYIFYTQIVSI